MNTKCVPKVYSCYEPINEFPCILKNNVCDNFLVEKQSRGIYIVSNSQLKLVIAGIDEVRRFVKTY